MTSPRTLHEFMLNLFNEPAALISFLQDPAGMLESAHLVGLEGTDIRDIVPLAMDLAPAYAAKALWVLSDEVAREGGQR